jgi:hypothetical protein
MAERLPLQVTADMRAYSIRAPVRRSRLRSRIKIRSGMSRSAEMAAARGDSE